VKQFDAEGQAIPNKIPAADGPDWSAHELPFQSSITV
jgi:hypothetical protein